MAHLKGLGGLLGGGVMLKKKPVRKPFTELKIKSDPDDWKKTPTARIRDIDMFRLHIPCPSEREAMKIPESYERIIMNDNLHMMILCGGLVGVHFTSEEIMEIRRYTSELDVAVTNLEHFFNSLPGNTKRHRLSDEDCQRPPPPPRAMEEPSIYESTVPRPPPPAITEVAPAAATGDAAAKEADLANSQVIEFHSKADCVQAILYAMQNLVISKQGYVITEGNCRNRGLSVGDEEDNDGEGGLSVKPRPVWMETLIRKYTEHMSQSTASPPHTTDVTNHREISNTTPSTTFSSISSSSSGEAMIPAPSVGKFACFLSCCVTGQIDCTRSEHAAMIEMLMASSNHGGHVGQPANWRDEVFSHTQIYWAHRFFEFIKKLPEFKTAIKDENSLPKFHLYI